jgi:hypothetical protein
MKFLATLLCVYILFVSAMPCCHNNETDRYSHQTEQQATDSGSHSDCSGMCSPFCACHTCGGFTVILPAYYCQPEQEFSKADYNFPPTIYSLFLPEGIWQPPKIS